MKRVIYFLLIVTSFSVYSQATIWEENFEASTIPSDWTTWDGGGGEGTTDWTFGTGEFPWTDYDSWDLDNNAAIFSDYTPDEESHNIRILARTGAGTDASNFTNLKLKFQCSLRTSGTYGNGKLYILVRDEGSNTWRYIASYTDDIMSAEIQLDLEAFMQTYTGIDRSNLKVGFMYDDLGNGITYGAGIGWVKITGDPPQNDTCSNATEVWLPYELLSSSSLWGATNNNGGVDACEENHTDGIWYTFTANHSWNVNISLFPLPSSSVEVYSGSCNSLTCVPVDFDPNGDYYQADYYFDAVAGTQYWINISVLGITDYSDFDDSFSIFIRYTPPDNDYCGRAYNVDLPYSRTQSLNGTTNGSGFITTCAPGMNDGVWYKYYANLDGDVILEAQASQVDLEIGFYVSNDGNSCSDLSCVDNEDSLGFGEEEVLSAHVTQGNWYFINIGYFSYTSDFEEEGDMTFNMYYQLPENDICSSSVELTCNSSVQGTTAGAENDIINMCNIEQTDVGVWYHFTSEYGGLVSVAISDTSNGSHSENLSTFTGECGDVECQFNYEDNNPYIEFETQIGTDYYFYVSTEPEYVTNFTLTINCIAPANDEATGAYDIDVNPIGATCTNPTTVWNANGVTDSSPINGTPDCANYAGGDSWYKFIAPTSGGIKINRPNAGDWGALGYAIYDSTTGTSPLVCNYITQSSTESTPYTGLIAGNYYWLRVWEWNNNDYGSVGICLEEVDTLGFDDLSNFGFSFAPNPVEDKLQLKADQKIKQISIYSILGQKVFDRSFDDSQMTLDISNLKQGTYFVKVQIAEKTGIFKIIKQ